MWSTDAGVDACSLGQSNVHRVCGHVPRPRGARGSGSPCCAAFALGSPSSTTCPASYNPPSTAGECKSAADAASKAFGGSVTYWFYPYGCYWHTVTGSAYYNTNASGAANFYAQPLCAG